MTTARRIPALLLGTMICLGALPVCAQSTPSAPVNETAPSDAAEPAAAPPEAAASPDVAGQNATMPAGAAPQDATAPASQSAPKAASALPLGLWGLPVKLQGFHLQIGFGIGGGPDTSGLFHSMEIGYTFKGHTVAMLHTFIQNKGILGTDDSEPDLIGGWMVEYKHPLFFPDLVYKVAIGLGGIHEQEGGIKAYPGIGVSYGLDLNLPLHPRFGPTLTLAGMNVTARGQHHFGVGCALGFTVF